MGVRMKVEFDYISGRQDLIPLMETRKRGLEPYMMDRTDMYWANVHLTDEHLEADLSFSIDPSRRDVDGWTITKQYGSELVFSDRVTERVRKAWLKSPECEKATAWAHNLTKAGYFDHDRAYAPNATHGVCPHCGSLFEKGTSHPHTRLKNWNFKGENKVIYHHRLLEKTIKELGLTKHGISALPDVPSLEEIGELETVTVS